jgi:hypothetical protein
MRYILILATLALAGVAMAQSAPEDSDGDGVYSMEEMQATYPNLTDEAFAEIDANEDGAVDADELAAALAAGLLGG